MFKINLLIQIFDQRKTLLNKTFKLCYIETKLYEKTDSGAINKLYGLN